MKVIIENKKSGSFVATFLTGCLSIGAGYSLMALNNSNLGFALAAAAVASAVVGMAAAKSSPRLVIDDTGVLDSRLGVGKIAWSDIEDVQIEAKYGNRFLCFRVRNPDIYIARIKGPKKAKALFHQQLGFKRFNVDVEDLEVSLVDLKKEIDALIARHGPPN